MASQRLIPFEPLDWLCDHVRTLNIPWDSYFERGLISGDEMSVLRDLLDRNRWSEFLAKDERLYVTMVFRAIKAISEREAVISLMTTIDDLLLNYSEVVVAVLRETPELATGLEPFLRSPEDLVSIQTVRLLYVINRLLGFCCSTLPLLSWFQQGLLAHGEREARCLAATLLLQFHLQLRQFRVVFFESTEAMTSLVGLIRSPRSLQIHYHALFSLWILTFDREIAGELQARYEVIPVMLDLARSAMKEKVIRLCVACWANFLIKARRIAIPVMIGAKVLDFVEHQLSRKLADEEMISDLHYIRDELVKAFQSLNSFDEYASELKSGKLHWSPPHKSAIFWQDNASRLEDNDGELLRILTRLLTHSTDPLVLSVAANDLGEYISRRPQGKRYIEALGTKQQLMHLMAHQNSDVRFNALNSVQKYIANLWST